MRKIIPATGWIMILLATLAACGQSTAPATAPAPVNVTIKTKPFVLEVADTPAAREHGLMDRKELPKDRGMIFIMDRSGTHAFWMKNTLIDLDAVWVNDAGAVVHIATMKAHDESTHRNTEPARYIIELNAGMARELGLTLGDKIDLPKSITDKH